MSVTVRWSGHILAQQQRQRLHAAILRSAVLIHNRARVLCSQSAKRITRRRTRTTSAGRRGSTYTHYVPSRPGQPPALRTGFGRSSITWWQVDDLPLVSVFVPTVSTWHISKLAHSGLPDDRGYHEHSMNAGMRC
jgi:hypothetical protein